MNRFLAVLLGLCLSGVVGEGALAQMTVRIAESLDPTALGGASPRRVAMAAPAEITIIVPAQPGDSVVELLKCDNGQRPCVITYPSGTTYQGNDPSDLLTGKVAPPPGDTLMLMDACGRPFLPGCSDPGGSSTVARIEKSDSEVDKVEIKGLEITSLDDVSKTVTINVDTGPNNFAPPTGTGSREFAITLFFGGAATTWPIEAAPVQTGSCAFQNGSGAGTACPASQLTVTTNATTRGQMNITTPCDAGASTASANPCLSGDIFDEITGDFAASKTQKTTCVDACAPQHQALVSHKFNTKGQTLLLLNSGVAAMSRLEVEQFGVEALFHSIADEFEKPFWVSHTSVDNFHRAFLARKDQSQGTIELAFSLQRTTPVLMGRIKRGRPDGAPSILLNSLVTTREKGQGDGSLPDRERARNDRSYASFIARPQELRWRDVTTLDMEYDFTLGRQSSGDPRLGNMVFADCAGNSVYVRVALVKEDGEQPRNLLIRLGTSQDFMNKCWSKDMDGLVRGALSGVDLVKEGSRRVDVTDICDEQKLMSVVESQQHFGYWFVRSISLVVDQGFKKRANYQVQVHNGHVNESALIDTMTVPDPNNWTQLTAADLPIYGRSIQISRADELPSKPIRVLQNHEIMVRDSQLIAHISLPELVSPLAPIGTEYRVDLCLFGGTCIAQGKFRTVPTQVE